MPVPSDTMDDFPDPLAAGIYTHRMALDPDVELSVHLDAICARGQYTHDPAPVIVELRLVAGERLDILHETVGKWAGYFDSRETHTLCSALLEAFPESEPWVQVGRRRRGHVHSTDGFDRP